MGAKTTPGYVSKLTQVLETTDRILPVEDQLSLLNRLDTDSDFTTLLIQDTVGYEVVKVLNHQGSIVIDRGLSGTQPKRFPVGSCVMWSPSDELLKAISGGQDCGEDGVDDTYGDEAENPTQLTVETLPNSMIGGVNGVLGEPTGFMLINGKKVPYYD